jgi:hypothetical protein
MNEKNYCETCKHRDSTATPASPCLHNYRVCNNGNKLLEGHGWDDNDDSLIYAYDEGGCFYVGPKFGCVHHEEKE